MDVAQEAPFRVKDCALAAIGTGLRARNLRELHMLIEQAHPGCIYYHFWGMLLRPMFENPEYLNDFAEWAAHGLHDQRLAERLGVIDPAEFSDTEALRRELLDKIEERLDESEMVPWAKADRQFHFVRSQIVVFDTRRVIAQPSGLPDAVAAMSTSSVFYHFIDARLRTPDGEDDFCAWLGGFGPRTFALREEIKAVDPYFVPLRDLRDQLAGLFRAHFDKEK